jgi:Na+/citrate or Na+/malate symporter
MPIKSGASHGLSAFATALIGSMYSDFVWAVLPPAGELAMMVMGLIRSYSGLRIPINQRLAGTIVIMFILSSLWGITYHLSRHSVGRDSPEQSSG